jgi:triosephosphate isomerase (TIM)
VPHELTAPFFEIGPKNYLSRKELLELSSAASVASAAYDVRVIITPPALDLEIVKALEPELWVFAQGMDLAQLGPSTGALLPEALADVGADGVLLNHPERPLSDDDVAAGVERAHRCHLLAMVCAEDESQARTVATYGADIVLSEPRRLIGTSIGAARPWIPHVNRAVSEANPHALVMHGGGIAHPSDVLNVMSQGADGTGCTSAVVFADDRLAVTHSLIRAVREGWDKRNDPST